MSCRHFGCTAVYGPARATGVVGDAAISPLAVTAAPTPINSALTSFTWSGATPTTTSGAPDWSHGSNWAGGVVPSGSVGTLTFPLLTAAACTSSPPTDTCYTTEDNLTGLSANELSVNIGAGYQLSGTNAVKLGSAGLTASTTSTTPSSGPFLNLPLTLTAPQTWTLEAPSGGFTQVNFGDVSVTGSTEALKVNSERDAILGVDTSNFEVGPVTITSTETSGSNGFVGFAGGELNATDGKPVTLEGVGTGIVVAVSSGIGALDATGGSIQVESAAELSVHGGFTQGASDSLTLNVNKPGTTAGTDYSQLSATGAVSLAGTLTLRGESSSGTCPTLHVGDVDTLLTTTGSLSGTFSGVPNGTTVRMSCGPGIAPTIRINYTAKSVTGTVVTAGGGPTVTSVVPNAGSTAGGNTVTIHGTNFTNGPPPTTVHFGSDAATSVTFVSSTEVTAKAPAEAAGVVNVTVTTAGGATTATSNSDLYAYGPPTVTSFSPTSGITGSAVTVTGKEYVPGAKVKFGALSSPSVTFVSPTELKATVPNGATAGKISVTTAAGTGTSSSSFTPTLSITSFSPASGGVGTLVTIDGVGFTSGSTVEFNGTAATTVPVSSTELKATVPTGATTGPISVTNTSAPTGTVRSATSFSVT